MSGSPHILFAKPCIQSVVQNVDTTARGPSLLSHKTSIRASPLLLLTKSPTCPTFLLFVWGYFCYCLGGGEGYLCCCFVLFLETGFLFVALIVLDSLYRPGWPLTHKDLHATASGVLRVKALARSPGWPHSFNTGHETSEICKLLHPGSLGFIIANCTLE